MITKEISTEKAFAKTNIDLGDYVLNPYKGCFHQCLYCYVKTNKFFSKHPDLWESTIYVKTNFVEKMQKEWPTLTPTPEKVLIGATTEVYMPQEKHYTLMRPILNFLNEKKISITILTKSNLIERDIDLLKQNSNPKIYLTINQTSQNLKNLLESHTTKLDDLWTTLEKLTQNKIKTVLYISPAFPFFTDWNTLITRGLEYTDYINIETFNPILLNLEKLKTALHDYDAKKFSKLEKIYNSEQEYKKFWNKTKEELEKKFPAKTPKLFINPYQSYFNNSYLG